MYNKFFKASCIHEKKQKLRRILKEKAPQITEEQLDMIFAVLDFEHQYYIKVIHNEQKFKNMITNEQVYKNGKITNSTTQCIFGNFTSGFYLKNEQITEHISSKVHQRIPVAAIKTIIEKGDQAAKIVRYLILYFPSL